MTSSISCPLSLRAGSGATAAIDVAVRLLPESFVPLGYASRNVDHSLRPAVIIGPYEHHSNILPWRESNADVFELSMEQDSAVIDMNELRQVLEHVKGRPLIVGSFSAASNVDGTLTDVVEVTKLLHEYGALSFFDYASAGPYVRINVQESDVDAVFISPHKVCTLYVCMYVCMYAYMKSYAWLDDVKCVPLTWSYLNLFINRLIDSIIPWLVVTLCFFRNISDVEI
jgi:selenocysteine lyase/cysteine desulfurase